MSLGTPDLFILTIILLSVLIGVIRGFIKESISLVTWVIAICLAIIYVSPLASHMTFTKVVFVRNLTAFLVIFVGIVFIGAIINYFVGSFIRKTPFSAADRILGSAFGALRGVFLITILILIGGLTSLPEEAWWHESYAIGHFQELAVWVKDRLPDENAKVFHFSHETETEILKGS